MPKKTTILEVFISSPSDVQKEREMIENIMDELNQSLSKTLGILFQPLKWETHVHPAFGTDPQSVINEQIGDSYDIFIGVLWGRFGTPTPRALSGTFEEFQRAYNRLKDNNPPEIMFYFKDTAIPPSQIDPVQIKQVQDFKNSISGKGGIYSVFEDDSSFQNSLRTHLIAVSKKFKNSDINIIDNNVNIIESDKNNSSDDLGYLDYIEIYENRMADFNSILNNITDATERIGNQFNKHTQDAEEFSNQQQTDAKVARRIVKRASDDMYTYADILKKQLPMLSDNREAAFNSFTNALLCYKDFNSDRKELEDLSNTLNTLITSIQDSRLGLSGFKDSVQNLPRLTSDLNKAKRTVLEQLLKMLNELDITEQTVNNILQSISTMLD